MKEPSVLYFAYGSNMSTRRLKAADRVPSACPIGRARLEGFRLLWTKRSGVDGSGKCHIEETGRPADVVWGVLFTLPVSEKRQLDRAEGRGEGYEEREVTVESPSGPVTAVTYYPTDIDPALLPTPEYKAWVVEGAEEHGLPKEYVGWIRSVPVVA